MNEVSAKRDRQSTEKKIKKAAYILFSKKGFKSTTVRMISEKSGCNITLISRYFGGKENLFKAVVDDEFKGLSLVDVDLPETESLSEELKLFFSFTVDIINSKKDFFRMMTRMAVDESLYGKMIKQIQQAVEALLQQRLKRLIENKYFETDIELEKISHMIMIYMNGLIFRTFIINDISRKEIASEVEDYLNFIINKYF